MASRFISLLLTLTLCAHILAQDIICPTGSSLKTDVTIFTVSAPPSTLEPILGDFYSSSWQSLLLQTPIVFTPESHSRILNYPLESLNLTEALLSSTASQLQWHLVSQPFTLPPLPPSSSPIIVVYYTQSLSYLPVCPNDAYTTITWTIHACISPSTTPSPSDEEGESISWFKLQHRKAAGNIFDSVSRGWFGNISTEEGGDTCSSYDTRVPELAPTTSSGGREPVVTPTITAGGPGEGQGQGPVPTTTLKATYPLIPGPATVTWPAGATGSNVGGSVSSSAAKPETVLREEEGGASTSSITIETYRPEKGGVGRRNIGGGLVGVVGVVGVMGWLLV